MRAMLIVTASLMVGLLAFGVTISEVAAQDAPPQRPERPEPPRRPERPEPPKSPGVKLVKVVYRSQQEHEKRFNSEKQAEDFARRLRTEGFNVEIHPRRNNSEFEVEYRLRQERTKVFSGSQALANANSFATYLRGLRADAKVVPLR